MKCAAISYTELLSGAGIAALRIHRALLAAGTDSSFLVLRKRTSAADVHALGDAWTRRAQALRARATKALLHTIGGAATSPLSANLLPTGMHRRLNALDADLLHLHWVGAEMIGIDELGRLEKPVVWTLHDEWLTEGLSHYGPIQPPRDHHPATPGLAYRSLDRAVRSRKAKLLGRWKPLVVCPSQWLAQQTLASSLVEPDRIRVVPNPIPIGTYRQRDRLDARRNLGLPERGRIIGFGAVQADADPRKGYALLLRALETIGPQRADRLSLLVFGATNTQRDLPLPARFVGNIAGDEEMAMLYAAMDVFVCPSMQENLPNTIGEAMACGVPCTAFAVGGIPDLIEHKRNGYLAAPFDAEDLGKGILDCLAQARSYGDAARAHVEQYMTPEVVAAGYAAVYEDALRLAADS